MTDAAIVEQSEVEAIHQSEVADEMRRREEGDAVLSDFLREAAAMVEMSRTEGWRRMYLFMVEDDRKCMKDLRKMTKTDAIRRRQARIELIEELINRVREPVKVLENPGDEEYQGRFDFMDTTGLTAYFDESDGQLEFNVGGVDVVTYVGEGVSADV